MSDRHQLRFALAALLAGLLWGYARHRGDRRTSVHSALQGLEWFIAYGGAAALVALARNFLERADPPEPPEGERVTHFRQVVAERTGTEG
ncbi:MAG: hypothetical protein FJ035_04040 [Chloroflexi bacterium]|nr:hypothetical protein [Chloroflexota bacterium]